jgi:hypothetical protein
MWLALCMDVIPIFTLINNSLCVCMLLSRCLCFITTMFMQEVDQVKPWSPVQLLAIRKFSGYFYVVLLVAVKPENHKKLVTYFFVFCFIILRPVSAWQPPQLVEDAKLFVLLQVAWRVKKKNHLSLSPRVRYKPQVTIVGENFSCCITLRLESQQVWL